MTDTLTLTPGAAREIARRWGREAVVHLVRQLACKARVGVERGDLLEPEAGIERRVPFEIAEGRQGQRPETCVARIDQASAHQPCADPAPLIGRGDVHFPDVQFAAERLGDKEPRHRLPDMGDKAVAPADQAREVERVKRAGSIIIGKTNTPEFGLGSNTYNDVFGRTLNAYDQTKTSGGSTGGGAVAAALRMLREVR